ncbi:mitochondrion biogenesis protein [Grosmannia clavigera kw1407]|uniref:Sensitive to high expression protein 9, mitochondrial n=1 Tax=Grosmannia clavigera (strain kw1407 / UAMH 11150) TaxID=655863 RepID=F0X841_GROCL|nr:mitochondrion biogenesis protein [Grosmannia clavigera kw1407]EFX05731.1 mitochondrion biogenesis protein [Grosmannia clavigera kw1407]
MAGPAAAWWGAGPSGTASRSWMTAVAAVARPNIRRRPMLSGGTSTKSGMVARTGCGAVYRWQAFGTVSMPPRQPWSRRPCPDCGAVTRGHGYRSYSSLPPRLPGDGSTEKQKQQQQQQYPPLPFPLPSFAMPSPAEPVESKAAETEAKAEAVQTEVVDESSRDKEASPRAESSLPRNDDTLVTDAELPSVAESGRTRLGAQFSRVMDELQGRVLVASQTLNDLTGYSAIEQIKARNAELESELAAAQTDLHVARREYQAVNERRAGTQREVTTLLARKDTWAPADLERFTGLYRHDHELEAAAGRAVERLQEAEATESRLSAAVTAGILKRYHEEQVWSDRIRRQSTWGTWGLMMVNVLLFIVLQFFAEPWRRSRLMRSIAEAESSVLDDVRHQLADVQNSLAGVLHDIRQRSDTIPDAPSSASVSLPVDAAAPVLTEALASTVPLEKARDVSRDDIPATYSLAHLRLIFQRFQLPQLPQLSLPVWLSSWDHAKLIAAQAVDVARWEAWVADLCSERTVYLRQRDVSLIAAQSAAAGASFVGFIALLVWRLS